MGRDQLVEHQYGKDQTGDTVTLMETNWLYINMGRDQMVVQCYGEG